MPSPPSAPSRAWSSKLQQWLCFIGTELHKSLFTPLFGKTTPPEVKAYTLEKYLSRLEYLDKR